MSYLHRFTAIFTFILLAGSLFAAADSPASLETWRAERIKRLTAPTSWLSLIGLHFLQPGENTVGHSADSRVVLAAGPDHFGVATLAADGTVSFAPADPAVQIDGKPAGPTVLGLGGAGHPATLVSSGTVSFFVIDRGGKKALRVRDTASARRANFVGIDAFPEDAAWRIEARWEAFPTPREIPITNILGQVSPAKIPGKAIFTHEGRTYELLPMDEGAGEPLFFVISDATSGQETYAAARFLYAEAPRDGKVILDFNRAINPPCAFTPFATCPLPPKENRLPFAVTAGEKNYRGEHH